MGFIALKCMGYGVWGRYGLSCQISCVPSWDPQEHMGYEGLSDIREMAYEGGDCIQNKYVKPELECPERLPEKVVKFVRELEDTCAPPSD
jgi:hypothetical protein